ncbi:hypothetical protein CGMCC3_g7247 [Colletotrichum fructicola]|nr:uncharacterized protein CGMCC3_g7247 [Colletotrichum fructicola]KAE9576727.1 hypothetical protein CGMCC3_g7247 [Colletotrichum fructicola]
MLQTPLGGLSALAYSLGTLRRTNKLHASQDVSTPICANHGTDDAEIS